MKSSIRLTIGLVIIVLLLLVAWVNTLKPPIQPHPSLDLLKQIHPGEGRYDVIVFLNQHKVENYSKHSDGIPSNEVLAWFRNINRTWLVTTDARVIFKFKNGKLTQYTTSTYGVGP